MSNRPSFYALVGTLMLSPLFSLSSQAATSSKGICARHIDIQRQILKQVGVRKRCDKYTAKDLLKVEEIDISYENYETYGYVKRNGQWSFKDPSKISVLRYEDLKGLYNLKYLALQFTNISSLSRSVFKDVKNLVELDLSHNLIREFKEDVFWDLKKLESIEFDTNEYFTAGTLPRNLFKGLRRLKKIDMDECRLRSLPDGLFRDNVSLEVIDLGKNFLHTLPYNIFLGPKNLDNVILKGNGFKGKVGPNHGAICTWPCWGA